MSDSRAGLDDLPVDVRERLDTFTNALDRLHVDDLPLYVARVRQPRHRRAVESAELVAIESGLADAVQSARRAVIEGILRAFADRQFRVWVGGMAMAPDFGPVDQRVRVAESIGEAVTAIALGDRLAASDRAELLGLWDRLLP